MLRAWPAAPLLLLALSGPTEAAEACQFSQSGSTWTLVADCTVDSSIVLPDAVTLDGARHTIIALDPEGGFFRGGIIVSGGRSASVTNTVISAVRLADVCQQGNDRLRAIQFNGASGVIAGNSWAGDDTAATAILLVNTAPGTLVRSNVIVGNADVGIYVMANGARVERNRLTDSGPDG